MNPTIVYNQYNNDMRRYANSRTRDGVLKRIGVELDDIMQYFWKSIFVSEKGGLGTLKRYNPEMSMQHWLLMQMKTAISDLTRMAFTKKRAPLADYQPEDALLSVLDIDTPEDVLIGYQTAWEHRGEFE